ncbi:unnamed protein product [Durusdinium trenchii]|uniref:SET domain-containing protein n=1 Tax=Durusdinium trenchii TaxID=1381693 RepID=A0ABP0M297_9DINO
MGGGAGGCHADGRPLQGPTFKEVVLQKQEKLKLTDPKILTVVDCNGRPVSVYDGEGQMLEVLSGQHIPRKVETESEVCQRSFPLQFQKKAPEGRTLAVRPSCLRVREEETVEALRKRKVEMSVGTVHAKPELDGQFGLLGAFQASTNAWEVMPDARGLWDVQIDGSAAPVKLRSPEICDEATGKAFVDPVQIGDWKTVPEEKALYARVTLQEGEVILEDEPAISAPFSFDMPQLMKQFNQMSPSRQDAILQLSKGPDFLASLRSETRHFTKETLQSASPEFSQLNESLQDQIWSMMRTFDCNSFSHSRSKSQLLYPTLARVNHSCRPNAVLGDPKPAEQDAKLHSGLEPVDLLKKALIAIEEIPEGEEITVSYLSEEDLLEPRPQRRQRLMDGFGFECFCSRCLDEDADRVLRTFRSAEGEGSTGTGGEPCEEMHVSSFADFLTKLSKEEPLSSPDELVAIAETASETLAPSHWLLRKVHYVLSCFYEKNHRPALAVEHLQGILDLELRALGRISPSKWEQKGDQLVMKGDLPQAFECYAQVLKALKLRSPEVYPIPGRDMPCEEIRKKLRSVLDGVTAAKGYPSAA